MFERYTEQARQAIFFARYEASAEASSYIETSHLLLGIVRANPAIRSMIGDVDTIREELTTRTGQTATPMSVDLPLSHACKKALDRAAEESKRATHKNITTLHLLAGLLLTDPYDPAHTAIGRRGLTIDAVRARLDDSEPGEPLDQASMNQADAIAALPPDRQTAASEILHTLMSGVRVEIVVKTDVGERSYRFS